MIGMLSRIRSNLLCGLAVAALLSSTGMATAKALCRMPEMVGYGAVKIGEIWSGVRTSIGAALIGNNLLVASYYNRERYLTISAFDVNRNVVCELSTSSRFSGWDAHNVVSLAVDEMQMVHVSGNMHNNRLVYFYGRPDEVNSFEQKRMVGRDEDRVTYPKFTRDANGDLLFIYRNGSSGDGRWFMNRWRDGRWHRLAQIFSDRDANGPVSAYPTAFVRDRSGATHVAVVWRKNSDISSNFLLSYASTRDFTTWTANGKKFKSPLSPENMEIVDNSGSESGLVNNASLYLNDIGDPFILYTKYNQIGHNAAFMSRKSSHSWSRSELKSSINRMEIVGKGTIPNLPRAVANESSQGPIRVSILFKGEKRHTVWLDETNGKLMERPKRTIEDQSETGAAASSAPSLPIPNGLHNPRVVVQTVHQQGEQHRAAGSLRWFAQETQKDIAQKCTPTAPIACSPPSSPLIWSRK